MRDPAVDIGRAREVSHSLHGSESQEDSLMRLHADQVRRRFTDPIPRRINGTVVAAFAAALVASGPAAARDVQAVPVDVVGEPLCSTEAVHITGTLVVSQAE